MSEDNVLEKNFLKITSIRTSSNAFQMKLKENDIIFSLDGELVNITYDDFSKELSDLKERKILTLYRDGTFFNTFIAGPLGVICEEVNSESITDLNSYNVKENLDLDAFYQQFEVFKKPGHTAILINTFPTILASFASPLWMIQNRLWNFFWYFTSIFFRAYDDITLVILRWLDIDVLVCR